MVTLPPKVDPDVMLVSGVKKLKEVGDGVRLTARSRLYVSCGKPKCILERE